MRTRRKVSEIISALLIAGKELNFFTIGELSERSGVGRITTEKYVYILTEKEYFISDENNKIFCFNNFRLIKE